MRTPVSILRTETVKDSEGFSSQRDVVLAEVRAYHEARHGSERWANRAAFSEATDLFRFRAIPSVEISTALFYGATAAGTILPAWKMSRGAGCM